VCKYGSGRNCNSKVTWLNMSDKGNVDEAYTSRACHGEQVVVEHRNCVMANTIATFVCNHGEPGACGTGVGRDLRSTKRAGPNNADLGAVK
jgi:hypothetical protein